MRPALTADRQALILQNMHLPRITARRYIQCLPPFMHLDDLIAAGNYGLCKAAREFDFGRHLKFYTYAITLIRGEILETLRDESHAPRTIRDKVRADRQKSDTGGQNDTVLMLTVSYHEPHIGDEARSLLSILPDDSPGPEQLAFRIARRAALTAAVDRLPERERFSIQSYYSDGLTHKQIGAALEISESRAYQLWQQGVTRLRSYLQADAELFQV